MGLVEYRRKRHFQRTPEPAGRKRPKAGHSFVVQKHAARHLHYDFRLELEGVLKSWAVPKGPSLDPLVKRLAMLVEDHPVEYGNFEGIIPQGEYDGGTVLLWDRGTWEPLGDAHEDYRKGRLKFRLQGEKLRGGWMLVRTGGHSSERDERHWLLFKERDDEAKPSDRGDILDEEPLSVWTGRDLDEIAADRDWVWDSNKSSRKPSRKARRHRKTERPLISKDAYDARAQQFAGVRLTSPDKALYPEAGITKLELATYYQAVADWMLPHLADRPLVLVRCPEGRAKACFYQKHPAVGTPDALRQIPVREKQKTENYVLVDDVQGLISLAQISALEIHAWGSRADKLEQPDRLIFDLDPDPAVAWKRVIESAFQLRDFLLALGLKSFVKTTGGKGLHLVLPIERRHGWEEAKAFCKRVADLVVRADPNRYTGNMAKAARSGKIFLDYLRNARGGCDGDHAVLPACTPERSCVGAPDLERAVGERGFRSLHDSQFAAAAGEAQA
jgi:bifunctional non-homologous end joining protein LigD